ncbi:MAG TPA: cyclic nucleotide-binding domain-containing protein [Candidatus Binatia bacterium]
MGEAVILTTVEKVLFLKSVEIFERAAIEELGHIAALSREARFQAGAAIYRQGDPLESVYIIVTGRAAIQDGERIIREVGEKHAIGILASLDASRALRTVVALEPVHALQLAVEDFHDLLSSDFELVKAVFRVIARHIREGF